MIIRIKDLIINCDKIITIEELVDPKTDLKACHVTFESGGLTLENTSLDEFEKYL